VVFAGVSVVSFAFDFLLLLSDLGGLPSDGF